MADNTNPPKPASSNKPETVVRPKPSGPSNEQFKGNFNLGNNKGNSKGG